MLLMVFAIIMSIINLKLYYVCTSLHYPYSSIALVGCRTDNRDHIRNEDDLQMLYGPEK